MIKSTYIKINETYLSAMTMVLEEEKENLHPEDENIYALAFFGLLKNGCPYSIKEEEIEVEDAAKKGKNAETPKEIKRTVLLKVSGLVYECDEKSLIRMFGDEYLEIVTEKKTETKAKAKLETGDDFRSLPPISLENDKTEVKEAEEKKKKEKEEKKEKKKIPVIENDAAFPDDPSFSKEYTTFLYNRHEIEVSFADGTKSKYTAAVYPLYMDMGTILAADIMIVVADEEGRLRCAISNPKENKTRAVNAEFAKCTLVFRGEWRDNEFLTSVGIYSTEDDEAAAIHDDAIPIRPGKDRTSTFYLRHKTEGGDILSIFPLHLLKNNPATGVAAAVAMVEDGYSKKLYVLDGSFLSIPLDGVVRNVTAFWRGNNLEIEFED